MGKVRHSEPLHGVAAIVARYRDQIKDPGTHFFDDIPPAKLQIAGEYAQDEWLGLLFSG